MGQGPFDPGSFNFEGPLVHGPLGLGPFGFGPLVQGPLALYRKPKGNFQVLKRAKSSVKYTKFV